MKRTLGMFLALAVLALSMNGLMSGVLAQDATPTVDPAMVAASPIAEEDCAGVTEYARLLVMLASGLAAAAYGLPSDTVSEWTDEAYTKFIAALTWVIEELTGATAPEAAQKLNDYAIVAIKTVQGAIVFIRTSGIGGSLPFADQLDKVDDVLTTIITTLEEACPGSTEGVGTPVASPAAA
ncbi:MAG: hypothetical protein E6R14_12730 [Thermomicrobiales bacterium]|nr:MAG: hypothetical protein E6R14_12730 [Thermomicrobiales bacterium]